MQTRALMWRGLVNMLDWSYLKNQGLLKLKSCCLEQNQDLSLSGGGLNPFYGVLSLWFLLLFLSDGECHPFLKRYFLLLLLVLQLHFLFRMNWYWSYLANMHSLILRQTRVTINVLISFLNEIYYCRNYIWMICYFSYCCRNNSNKPTRPSTKHKQITTITEKLTRVRRFTKMSNKENTEKSRGSIEMFTNFNLCLKHQQGRVTSLRSNVG